MRQRRLDRTVHPGSLIARLPHSVQPSAVWLRSLTGWGAGMQPDQQTWDSEPLNGQHNRAAVIAALINVGGITCAIETGTYCGVTTEHLATLVESVVSIEVDPSYYSVAKERLGGSSTISLRLADSRSVLEELSAQSHVTEQPTLFYLDAHWGADLPLAAELTIICAAWSRAIVVIDDFEVPGDPGYGFDDYGPGARLDRSILPPLPGWWGAYPSLASGAESGARRGWVVLATPALRHVLDVAGLAAPWSL